MYSIILSVVPVVQCFRNTAMVAHKNSSTAPQMITD